MGNRRSNGTGRFRLEQEYNVGYGQGIEGRTGLGDLG